MIHKIKFKELALSIILVVVFLAIGRGLREAKAYLNADTESSTAQEKVEFVPLSVGKLEGSTYSNEYFGIQCTLDDTWDYDDEAELLERYNEKLADGAKDPAYLKALDDESVNEAVKEYNRIPLMISYGQDKFVLCYVYFDPENPGSWSEEEWKQYVEDCAAGLEHVYVQYGSANEPVEGEAVAFDDASVEVETIEFAGKTVYGLSSSYKLYGKTCYVREVLLAQDHYICDITALSFVSEADAQAVLDCFAAYEPQ